MSSIVSPEDVRFDARCVICRYVEDEEKYVASWGRITCRQDVRDLLGITDKTSSIHLKSGITVFSNPAKFMEHVSSTASTVDKKGAPHYWWGDFIVIADNGTLPEDIDLDAFQFALGMIKARVEFGGLYESEDN